MRRLESADADPDPMSAAVATPADAPAAVAAFARGVERRAAVLAELQCGDPVAGDAAVAAALDRFVHRAAGQPLAQWPQLFWTTLLAQPGLRQASARDGGGAGACPWRGLGSGPRAALLLPLAAGLAEADAAQVLGVSVSTYRLALQRALPHTADGHPDEHAWHALHEEVHRRIKTLPEDRAEALARQREVALHAEPVPAEDAPARPRATTGVLRVLKLLLGLCVLAFVATFFLPRSGVEALGSVGVEPLPRAAAPALRFGPDAAFVSHPDFGLLADGSAGAVAAEPEFYSWLAAQMHEGTGAAALSGSIGPVPSDGPNVREPAGAGPVESDAAL